MKKIIYLDNAATTPVRKEVLDEMFPFFSEHFGNASPIYQIAEENKKAIKTARERVAKAINADVDEIYFTAGGSESDNWALKGIAFANKDKGNHIITSKIEHDAILNSCKFLERNGFEVTYLDVDEKGFVREEDLKAAIKENTILISIMYANNEIGTIQPISSLSKIAKEKGIYFHTDAVQAMGNVKIDVQKEGIDLLTMSAHKFNGPKGVGALFIRRGVKIENLIHGGGQEKKKRAGTENVPGIVGMGKAIELHYEEFDENQKKLIKMRDYLIDNILKRIPYSRLNGDRDNRLPGNVNISFEFVEGESILMLLDMEGIEAASGSACNSASLEPSHVLLSIGLPHEIAHGSIRLSLSSTTDEKDLPFVVDKLEEIIKKLREMSPLYNKSLKEEL